MRAALPVPSQPAIVRPVSSTPSARETGFARPAVQSSTPEPAFAQVLHEQQARTPAAPATPERHASGRDNSAGNVDDADTDAACATDSAATADDATAPADASDGAATIDDAAGATTPARLGRGKAAPTRAQRIDAKKTEAPAADQEVADTSTSRPAKHDDSAAGANPSAILPGAQPVPAAVRGLAQGHGALHRAEPSSAADDAQSVIGRPSRAGAEPPAARASDATATNPVETASRIAEASSLPAQFAVASGAASLEGARPGEAGTTKAIDGIVVPPSPLPVAATPLPASAGAVPNVDVGTPVSSPDFAPAFALQVSLLVGSSTQRAELQLHPAEMGPVSVQINLDGKEARINFGADSALTRQIIEAGLPDLAGAMREAGFTLTGGGVSSHAEGRGDASRRDGRQGSGGAASGPGAASNVAPAITVRQPIRAGGIDVYA